MRNRTSNGGSGKGANGTTATRGNKPNKENTKRGKAAVDEEDDDADDTEDEGVDSSIEDLLDDIDDDEWDDTEEGGFGKVDEDNYHVKITYCKLERSKSSNRPQIAFKLQILGNKKYKGRELRKYLQIDDEQARARARGELARLGVPWPKKSELSQVLEDDVLGSYAEVSVKDNSSGDGQWVNFVKALDSEDVDDSGDDEDIEEDGDEAEEEEETKPARRGKPDKKAAKKPAVEEDDDDETSDDDGDDEASDDDDETPDDDEEEDDGDDEAAKIKAEFDDEDIPAGVKKELLKFAKDPKVDFNPNDYTDRLSLMLDMAEHVGLEGEFEKPVVLLKKMQDALAKMKAKKK